MKKLNLTMTISGFIGILLAMCLTACAGTVVLEWDAYTDTADGFNIYISSTSPVQVVTANKLATVTPSSQTIVTIEKVPNGMKYFVATAFQGEYESLPSNEVSGVVTPNKVLNLRAK